VGLVGLVLANITNFPYIFFVPQTPFLGQILLKFGGIFFGKTKGNQEELRKRKCRKTQ